MTQRPIARVFLLAVCLLAGASLSPARAAAQSAAAQSAAPPFVYHFQMNDVIEFKFRYSPELDFSAPVRPDGAIFFPYLGDIQVTDLTVSALAAMLRARYASILQSPEITITVRSFRAPRVFVAGEVVAPGHFDFRPGMTVSQAVYSAGGLREGASRSRVLVLRPTEPNVLQVIAVDIKAHNGRATDPPLSSEDIVLVPKSAISRLDQIIDQYSRQLLPLSSLGVFFNLMGSTAASASIAAGSPK